LTNLPGGAEAVHFWHLHVHQDDIYRLLFQGGNDFVAGVGDTGDVTQSLQHAQGNFLVGGVVFGEEDAAGGASALPVPG
jgi:hypothetical protein